MIRTVLLAAVLLSACGDDAKNAAGGAATPQNTAAAQTRAAAEEDEGQGEAEYGYNPIGKRDPFRTFLVNERGAGGVGPDPTPLQRYELEQYRLTGIVWGLERARALMEDPEGVGHVVELGTYIGKKWGKVTQITSEQLVVTEEYLTPEGTLVVNPIAIALESSEE